MFIKLIKDGLTVGMRTYPVGSVVRVDEARGRLEIEGKNAVLDSGPESEPKPEDDAEAAAAKGKKK